MQFQKIFTGFSHKKLLRLGTIAGLAGLALLVGSPTPPPARAAEVTPLSLSWLAIESGSYAVAWGDVDGDGDLDLAVAGGPTHKGLYRNDSGTLTTEAVWKPLGTDDARAVAWGDVDGDGDLDLVIGNANAPNRLYRNDNGVLTTSPVWSSTETQQTSSLAWGDEDGDGDLDLAVGNRDKPVRLYHNIAGVLTTSAVWSSTETSVTDSIAWGDVDSDGDLDLAVGNSNVPDRLYRNESGGTLTASAVWSSADITLGSNLAWGDVDGDGDLDLAVGSSSGAARVYRNDLGTLTTNPVWSATTTSNNTIVEWGDLDGDGDLDLISGGRYYIQLYRNNAGTLTASSVWILDGANYITDLAWGDVDGDGDLDLATGHGANLPARLYTNASEPLLAAAVWSSPLTGSPLKPKLAWGDVDGDGDIDLAVGGVGFSRMYQNNNGTLSTGVTWSSVDSLSSNFVAWGDVDGDLDLDLVSGAASLGLYRNDTGALTTSAVWTLPGTDSTRSMAWGDVDGDGDLDLAVGSANLQVRVYRNNSGTLSATPIWSPIDTNKGSTVEWGDVDGDGDLDLAVGNEGQPTRLYRNNGGTLTTSAVWSSANSDTTRDVAWGDVDGDGDLDLVTINLGPNRLYRNDNGVLTTTPVWSSLEGGENTSGAWGDADNDGDLDLAVGNLNEPVRMYRNEAGKLTTSAVWTASDADLNTYDVAWGDVDNDGDLDLAAGNSSYLRLYRNTRDNRALQNATPTIHIQQPNLLANFYADPLIWNQATIPINYTLYDLQGDPVDHVVAWYSPDGGGRWLPAVAASGTVTTNLSTVSPEVKPYTVTPNQYFSGSSTVTSVMDITSTELIYDLNIKLNLEYSPTSDLVVSLTAPNGRTVTLINRRGTGSNFVNTVLDDEAAVPISAGTNPFTGSYQPEQVLSLFDEMPVAGQWTLTLNVSDIYSPGMLQSWEMQVTTNLGQQYTYNWDPIASGFYGQSDNVVFRLRAVPAADSRPNRVPGPFLYNAFAATTTPFRVRGIQVRVTDGLNGVPNAQVFRQSSDTGGAAGLITNFAGEPYTTDSQGYLQGRGELKPGDKIIALLPVQTTDTYTRYITSAAPSADGLTMTAVNTNGVQNLVVSNQHQLILFNLIVSLQWDARADAAYMEQLENSLRRASQFLFDWTDGQAALGSITIYHNRQNWNDAHLRIYASNRQRPMALQGGIVSDIVYDPKVPEILYMPGQMHLGVTWNRYGETGINLADDWPRALAHEMAHWAFYMNDNYLGVDPTTQQVIPVNSCPSVMNDPYREDYPFDEFHDDVNWLVDCGKSLSEWTVGRSDWATLDTFYPALNGPAADQAVHAGPETLPLQVTRITWMDPGTASSALADSAFYLLENNQPVQPGPTARAFLYQDGWAIDLGGPRLDRVMAYGSKPGDRLCLYEPDADRLGCKIIGTTDTQQLTLYPISWHPDISLTPVSTTTLTLQVGGLPEGMNNLKAKLYPLIGQMIVEISLGWNGSAYTGTFNSPDPNIPLLEGYLQVWVNESEPRREMLVDFAVGGNPARMRGGGARMRGGGARMRGGGAPLMAANGGVILFMDETQLGPDDLFILQAATVLPYANSWTTQVGPAYRLSASGDIAPLAAASLVFNYMSSEVPPGEESWLKLYYLKEGETTWQLLPTALNTAENLASARVLGEGVYALMSSIPVPLGSAGWNLFAYPVNETRLLPDALASIAGKYTKVYGFENTDTTDPWKLFSPTAPDYVNDLTSLEFAKGYWIYTTQAVTLFLPGLSGSAALPESSAAGAALAGMPPTTFYGQVGSSKGFTPAAGQTVVAMISGHVCGQGVTKLDNGKVVYVIDVFAEDWSGNTGCGEPGAVVRFKVNGYWMTAEGVWDNTQVYEVRLDPIPPLYLPLMRK